MKRIKAKNTHRSEVLDGLCGKKVYAKFFNGDTKIGVLSFDELRNRYAIGNYRYCKTHFIKIMEITE